MGISVAINFVTNRPAGLFHIPLVSLEGALLRYPTKSVMMIVASTAIACGATGPSAPPGGGAEDGGSGGATTQGSTGGAQQSAGGGTSGSGEPNGGEPNDDDDGDTSSTTTGGGGSDYEGGGCSIMSSNTTCATCLEQACCEVLNACMDESVLGCIGCLDCYLSGDGAECCDETIGKNAWLEECVVFNCESEC